MVEDPPNPCVSTSSLYGYQSRNVNLAWMARIEDNISKDSRSIDILDSDAATGLSSYMINSIDTRNKHNIVTGWCVSSRYALQKLITVADLEKMVRGETTNCLVQIRPHTTAVFTRRSKRLPYPHATLYRLCISDHDFKATLNGTYMLYRVPIASRSVKSPRLSTTQDSPPTWCCGPGCL